MDLAALTKSLERDAPPEDVNLAVRALWWDAKGDWNEAHRCAQEEADRQGAWVHAYLHRKEGDQANAAYWYRRAAMPVASGPLDEEWKEIARTLLGGA
jgi:hypothetical protein